MCSQSSTQEAELRLPGVKELLKLGASSKSHQAIIEDKRKSLSMAFNIKKGILVMKCPLLPRTASVGSRWGRAFKDQNAILVA